MQRLLDVFGRRRVFLPVVHTIREDAVVSSVGAAVDGGADGVFLINQYMSTSAIMMVLPRLRRLFPKMWMGVNFLGVEITDLIREHGHRVDGVWTDTSYSVRDQRVVDVWRAKGLWFGGVCFKYQEDEGADESYIKGECDRAARIMDVVTTSGTGTGFAASKLKIDAFRRSLGPRRPLGVASGVTPENVKDYGSVDAFLVASGIESSFGVFDGDRLERLARQVHGEP